RSPRPARLHRSAPGCHCDTRGTHRTGRRARAPHGHPARGRARRIRSLPPHPRPRARPPSGATPPGSGHSARADRTRTPPPPKRTFGIEAMAGRARDDFQTSGLRFDEILPGNYDGRAHLDDMALDGVEASVVYPANTIFVYLEPDRGLAHACMRSYNDWLLEDFQDVDPARLVGLPMLPVDDGTDAAIAELDRVIAKGARGAFIPGMPRRPYHDRYYEPLWAAAAERSTPLTFHRTFGGPPPDQDFD